MEIRVPKEPTSGVYVGFTPIQERIDRGCKITTCARCGKLTGHWPRDSIGHEIVCLNCASDIPQIRQRIDQLARERE